MNTYVTSATIKQLREQRNLTQSELGELIGVCENIGRGSFENVEKEPHVFLVESARRRKFFRAVALDRIRRRYDACHHRTHRSGHYLYSHLFYPFFVFNENHILL